MGVAGMFVLIVPLVFPVIPVAGLNIRINLRFGSQKIVFKGQVLGLLADCQPAGCHPLFLLIEWY